MTFRFGSAGESHGPAILAILEGVPFGLRLDLERIDAALRRRQLGFGRSARMQLEDDRAEVVAGLYRGVTSGAPLVLRIANRDDALDRLPPVHRPRPGHADLAGAWRFASDDARPVLERASARETAARVAAGAVVEQVLGRFGVRVEAFVLAIGEVAEVVVPADWAAAIQLRDENDLRVADPAAAAAMRDGIRAAGREGDTLGGTFLVRAQGVPPGLGSLMQWDRRLDARLAAAMMSIPSAKGVEVGAGFASARLRGSACHDPIIGVKARQGNRAGGVEGGMSNGEEVCVRVAMKPLATLRAGLPTVDLRTGAPASVPDPQRSDVCAVAAGSIVGEAMMWLVLGEVFLERFGGATMDDLAAAVAAQSEIRLRKLDAREGGRGPAAAPA